MKEQSDISAENAIRKIALEIPEYCNTELRFEEMVVDAVKKVVEKLKHNK